MTKAEFTKALDVFKSTSVDTAERAVFMQDGDVAMVCAAWMNVPITLKCHNARVSWAGLWLASEYDLDEFQEASGVPTDRFYKVFQRAVYNRMLFPDGTVADFVSKKLKHMVVLGGVGK